MANRDAKKIERTLKDFSLGAMSGGGAGLSPVSVLPEKGNVGALYKLPNGEIWSWYHEERQEEVEVPDFSVGGTYQMQAEIDLEDLKKLTSKLLIPIGEYDKNLWLNLTTPLNEDGFDHLHISQSYHTAETADNTYYGCFFTNYGEEEETADSAGYDIRVTGGPILPILKLKSSVDTPVSITITQELADKLVKEGFTLNDIAFMFVAGTKTETITIVDEGYTKVNGAIILDLDNIQNYAIYNDTYYNASLIIDNVKRGVPVALKDGSDFSSLASANLAEGNSSISFSNGTNISLIPENKFNPATITGAALKEQMSFIKGGWGLDFRGERLMSYIDHSGQVSKEENQKLMAPGTIISLFDGLITLDYILSTGEEGDHIDYELYFNSPTQPWGELFGLFDGDPCLKTVYCKQSSIVVRSDWSNIEDSKEYSTDIIIKFADNTTKAIKTTNDYISTIFSQNIPA